MQAVAWLGFAVGLAARPKRPAHREPRAPDAVQSTPEETAESPAGTDTPLHMPG